MKITAFVKLKDKLLSYVYRINENGRLAETVEIANDFGTSICPTTTQDFTKILIQSNEIDIKFENTREKQVFLSRVVQYLPDTRK